MGTIRLAAGTIRLAVGMSISVEESLRSRTSPLAAQNCAVVLTEAGVVFTLVNW